MLLKNTYQKYKDIIPYAFFGVCTTLVNVVAYWCLAHGIGLSVMTSTIASWVIAVLFAYITNRNWVFHSKASGAEPILKEMIVFFLCRLVTGIVDWSLMWAFVDILDFNDIIVKISSNLIVILLNYIASKFLIFKR